MMLQIQWSDQWSYYQEKGLKATLLASKIELLEVLNGLSPPIEKDKIQADLDRTGRGENRRRDKGTGSGTSFSETRSILFGPSPVFQIGIFLSAISLLTKHRGFWLLGLGFGAAGLFLLIFGFFR